MTRQTNTAGQQRASVSGKTVVRAFIAFAFVVLAVLAVATWDALNNELDRLRSAPAELTTPNEPAAG